MEALFVLTVFAFLIGGVGWLLVKHRERQKQQDFERKVQARKLGWSYDGSRDGRIDYRFAGGGDGVE
ncbi:MAG: hypothetical protein ACRECQ_00700, partial [Burkholderiaceae bacterium]